VASDRYVLGVGLFVWTFVLCVLGARSVGLLSRVWIPCERQGSRQPARATYRTTETMMARSDDLRASVRPRREAAAVRPRARHPTGAAQAHASRTPPPARSSRVRHSAPSDPRAQQRHSGRRAASRPTAEAALDEDERAATNAASSAAPAGDASSSRSARPTSRRGPSPSQGTRSAAKRAAPPCRGRWPAGCRRTSTAARGRSRSAGAQRSGPARLGCSVSVHAAGDDDHAAPSYATCALEAHAAWHDQRRVSTSPRHAPQPVAERSRREVAPRGSRRDASAPRPRRPVGGRSAACSPPAGALAHCSRTARPRACRRC
jgi:hypothetical protein